MHLLWLQKQAHSRPSGPVVQFDRDSKWPIQLRKGRYEGGWGGGGGGRLTIIVGVVVTNGAKNSFLPKELIRLQGKQRITNLSWRFILKATGEEKKIRVERYRKENYAYDRTISNGKITIFYRPLEGNTRSREEVPSVYLPSRVLEISCFALNKKKT